MGLTILLENWEILTTTADKTNKLTKLRVASASRKESPFFGAVKTRNNAVNCRPCEEKGGCSASRFRTEVRSCGKFHVTGGASCLCCY